MLQASGPGKNAGNGVGAGWPSLRVQSSTKFAFNHTANVLPHNPKYKPSITIAALGIWVLLTQFSPHDGSAAPQIHTVCYAIIRGLSHFLLLPSFDAYQYKTDTADGY